MQQIEQRLEYLCEQSQLVTHQQYDRTGNAIASAPVEIARFHDILREIDELEVDFDRIRHIREIVRSYRQSVEEMERGLEHRAASSRHRHRHEDSQRRDIKARSANTVSSVQPAHQLSKPQNAATSSSFFKPLRSMRGSLMHNAQIKFPTGGASLRDPSSVKSESTQISSSKALVSQSLPLDFNG
jgi:Zn-dependent M16 (insulinase) family peptidase